MGLGSAIKYRPTEENINRVYDLYKIKVLKRKIMEKNKEDTEY